MHIFTAGLHTNITKPAPSTNSERRAQLWRATPTQDRSEHRMGRAAAGRSSPSRMRTNILVEVRPDQTSSQRTLANSGYRLNPPSVAACPLCSATSAQSGDWEYAVILRASYVSMRWRRIARLPTSHWSHRATTQVPAITGRKHQPRHTSRRTAVCACARATVSVCNPLAR